MTKEEKRIYNKEHYQANKEKIKVWSKQYYQANKEKIKEYYQANKEKCILQMNVWQQANKEKYRAYKKAYRQANREKDKEYRQAKCKTDPCFKLIRCLRSAAGRLFKMKGIPKPGSYTRMIYDNMGCTLEQNKQHFQSKFLTGMNWDNQHLWHVDHIKPLRCFDPRDPVQLKAALHYTNLQPLWAEDNLSKGGKCNPADEFFCFEPKETICATSQI